ncbi:DSBA oxidoreductase [Ktedonobacter sp. SOSP1-52]|uniref:DsbA family oxidoreductase n=1 Tax=Ktedonobacter sp. SOSP1-52 TaxID=2778366 RepID=UPI001914FD55|nr:DsbA family oxidoreductase [Ktedonobacter sp. SOSP1-52]GHO65294.1 DSBA oxidoreductase [Ktedonobacter sp. SOSP1-52]
MKVEIWSDVACPWCYIGKRHFEAALAEFPQREQVDVIWRSYQLDPNAPRDSKQTTGEALAKKFGGPEKVKAMNERVTQVAAEAGLEYHLDTAIYDNTFDAHRLIHFAAHKNLQDEAKERLLKAHFTEGAAVSDINELVRLGTEIGLDADELRGALESDAYADEVKADFQRGSMFGVQGVPFFAIDEKYGISGAQPSQVFAEVLTKAWSESHPLINFSGSTQDAGVCEGDNCAIPQND